jgi:hypothetical protein
MPDSTGISAGAYKLWVYMSALKRRYGCLSVRNKKMYEHFGVSERTVQRWKRELEASGWLSQQRVYRPNGRERASQYDILRSTCRRTTRPKVSPRSVTPLNPLRGTSLSSEREASVPPDLTPKKAAAAVAKQPSEAEIQEVRKDWGKRQIDRAAVVRVLVALAMRECSYASFRVEAARRVREVQPANRVGFVIRLAESGQFYGDAEIPIDDQVASIQRILAETAQLEAMPQ